MEALQASTRSAAEYLGILDSFGTVEKGKTADLVVLDANPLDDITNTRKIAGVMMGGHYFPKASLEKMLADVAVIAPLPFSGLTLPQGSLGTAVSSFTSNAPRLDMRCRSQRSRVTAIYLRLGVIGRLRGSEI
jgi:hypothetical protein